MQLLRDDLPGSTTHRPAASSSSLFVQFGLILAGLAAATFVAGWASDETSGRLEMVLATPLSRMRWALAGGAGMLFNVGVFVALGCSASGSAWPRPDGDLATPMIGALVLGLYAAALAGIGVAVGGVLGDRVRGAGRRLSS